MRMKMKTIELVCSGCGKTFVRKLTSHKYNMKIGRDAAQVCCSRRCQGLKYQKSTHTKRLADVHPMQSVYARMNTASHRKKMNRDLFPSKDDLLKVWENQNGKCAITGLPMVMKLKRGESSPYQASVDRIDSTMPYSNGNIQLVCLAINYAKHTWTTEQIREFLNNLGRNPTIQ